MTAVIWRKSWSLFNMLYIEKRHTHKKISDKISVTKITFFSKEIQHSSQYSFNFQFFYDWKQKVHQFLKSLRGVSIFYSLWVLLKFIFTLREYKKTVNLLKKEKVFLKLGFTPCKTEQPLQGMELQGKRLKHKKIKASRKALWKEQTVLRCLLILNLKPFRS